MMGNDDSRRKIYLPFPLLCRCAFGPGLFRRVFAFVIWFGPARVSGWARRDCHIPVITKLLLLIIQCCAFGLCCLMNSISFRPSIRLVWTFRANFPVARCANLLRTLFFAAPRSLHCLPARNLISSCLDWPTVLAPYNMAVTLNAKLTMSCLCVRGCACVCFFFSSACTIKTGSSQWFVKLALTSSTQDYLPFFCSLIIICVRPWVYRGRRVRAKKKTRSANAGLETQSMIMLKMATVIS